MKQEKERKRNMNDTQACKVLAKETQNKTDRMIAKYEAAHLETVHNGEPWQDELRAITDEFCERIRHLQRLYPNRKQETEANGEAFRAEYMAAAQPGHAALAVK